MKNDWTLKKKCVFVLQRSLQTRISPGGFLCFWSIVTNLGEPGTDGVEQRGYNAAGLLTTALVITSESCLKKHSILWYVRNNHYHASFLVTGVLGVPLWTVLPCASGPTTKWGSRKMDFVLTSDCRGDIRWSSDSKIKRESTRKWGQVRWFSAVSRLICCILWPSGCFFFFKGIQLHVVPVARL